MLERHASTGHEFDFDSICDLERLLEQLRVVPLRLWCIYIQTLVQNFFQVFCSFFSYLPRIFRCFHVLGAGASALLVLLAAAVLLFAAFWYYRILFSPFW